MSNLTVRAIPCDYCGVPILWLRTRNDNPMPVDEEPDPLRGNVIVDGDRAGVLGRTKAAAARAAGTPLRTPHVATCPDAHRWNRKQRRTDAPAPPRTPSRPPRAPLFPDDEDRTRYA